MTMRLFNILTLALVILVALHTYFWLEHRLMHDIGCACYDFSLPSCVMLPAMAISLFLLTIALLAYLRDGRSSLLYLLLAYLVLFIHCVMWLIALLRSQDLLHVVFHDMGIAMFGLSLILMLIAIRKRSE